MLPDEKKSMWLIWYTTVEGFIMVPFDLTSKGSAENIFLSAERNEEFGRKKAARNFGDPILTKV
jgi:hypothetical protein